MKVKCHLKENFHCDVVHLTVAELHLCRSCKTVDLLLQFRHQDDDQANGPGMGLLLRDATALEDPDLTKEGRPHGISIPRCPVVPSYLTFPREPAFESADVLQEGSI